MNLHRRWTGTVRITFDDATRLLLDEHATGVRELCERIAETREGSDPAG